MTIVATIKKAPIYSKMLYCLMKNNILFLNILNALFAIVSLNYIHICYR